MNTLSFVYYPFPITFNYIITERWDIFSRNAIQGNKLLNLLITWELFIRRSLISWVGRVLGVKVVVVWRRWRLVVWKVVDYIIWSQRGKVWVVNGQLAENVQNYGNLMYVLVFSVGHLLFRKQ